MIINEFVSDLKSTTTTTATTTTTTNTTHIHNVLYALISLAVDVEKKNSIIKRGIFDIIHNKLMKISPQPPEAILTSNYLLLSCLLSYINEIVKNNTEGINALLNSQILPCLLWTFESASSIAASSVMIDPNITRIQRNISLCLVHCTSLTYEQIFRVVNLGVIPLLLITLEKHINMIKGKWGRMDDEVIRNISEVLFNIVVDGNVSKELKDKKKNKFWEVFDEDGMMRLMEIFDFLHTQQSLSLDEKRIVENISFCICKLSDRKTSVYSKCVMCM
jgi:hypothetical protein